MARLVYKIVAVYAVAGAKAPRYAPPALDEVVGVRGVVEHVGLGAGIASARRNVHVDDDADSVLERQRQDDLVQMV